MGFLVPVEDALPVTDKMAFDDLRIMGLREGWFKASSNGRHTICFPEAFVLTNPDLFDAFCRWLRDNCTSCSFMNDVPGPGRIVTWSNRG